jgi:hypothetical protein
VKGAARDGRIPERQKVDLTAGADALDRLPDVGVYARRLVNDDEQIRRMKTLKADALVAFVGRETDRVIAQPEPQLGKIRWWYGNTLRASALCTSPHSSFST